MNNYEEVIDHFGLDKSDIDKMSFFNSTKIEDIGSIVAFDLFKNKGRAVIDYDPFYPFAVLRIIKSDNQSREGNETNRTQIAELAERITALEEKVKDGKTFVVTDGAYDIDDIAKVVAARLDLKTIIKN